MKIFLRYGLPIITLALATGGGYLWEPQAGVDAGVKISELLAVAIAITGVTVPLIIVYRAGLPIEIRVQIAQTIEAALASRRIKKDTFIAACANMEKASKNSSTTEADKPLLLVIEKAHRAKETFDHKTGKYPPLPDDVKHWLFFQNKRHARLFSYFHDSREDRIVCTIYVVALIALGVFCFLQLYGRFLGDVVPSPKMLTYERALLLTTVGMNFITYGVLWWFVYLRSFLEGRVDAGLWMLCPQIESDVALYEEQSRELAKGAEEAFPPAGKPRPRKNTKGH